jgi:ABC-type antimicrobial peptide transport system permease subunit
MVVGPNAPVEVVGVVQPVRRVGSLEPLVLYLPIAQQGLPTPPPGSGLSVGRRLTFRATDDAAAAIGTVATTIRGMDPEVRLDPMTTMEESTLDGMAPQRFAMTVMAALGGIALLLSGLGTYVLAESTAEQRRREMGIRAALGATGRQLRALLLGDTARLVGSGLALGVVLSWLGAGSIRAFLFQIEPLDPWVIGGVAALIATIALLVSLRPAFAAARLDLTRLLRED